MADVTVININGISNRWQKLLLTLANRPEVVIRCSFPDGETAGMAGVRMNAVIRNRPSWFNLLVAVRGADVFVVKLNKSSKVVVRT